MPDDVRAQITAEIELALGEGPPVAVATVVQAGAQAGVAMGAKLLVRRDGSTLGAIDGGAIDGAVREAALAAFETFPRPTAQTLWVDASRAATARRSQARPGDAQIMLELFEAPASLVIVGGGHVGLALATLGDILGFGVTVIDDRAEFANRERFPMAERVLTGEVGAVLDDLDLGTADYVVLVSRGHQVDELALRHVVGRGAAYVGMIGSRRRTATVLQHLADDGVPREVLDRVHTPVGLDIGAETPEEIALAILAEIVLVRKGGSGRKLSTLPNRRTAERLGAG